MNDRDEIRLDPYELKAMRRTLHRIPEIGFEEHRTAAFIAERLDALGYTVHRGMAKTGVVGTLRNGSAQRAIGLRADMDGLPITEQTGRSYASEHPGRLHACGHDGHMAMLLGAAAAIAERRRFDGSSHLIFQPAEENFGGARTMPEVRDFLEKRITAIARHQAESFGVKAEVDYRRSYDATVNHPAETAFVRDQAISFVGEERVIDLQRPFMGSEDFTYMLQACPGCYFFIGTRTGTVNRPLHHPAFDFNDAVLPIGAGFWTRLTEAFLAPA